MKNLKVLEWKPETTYGVDSLPTNTNDVLLAQDVDINPLEQETDDYEPVTDHFGAFEKIVGGSWCTISFVVLVGGGGTPVGTAGKAPNHDGVLRACGMARTITAATSIAYTNIDTGEESATCYYFLDGVRQKMVGIRGKWTLEFNAMKAPRLRFQGMGLNQPMTDAPLPVPTIPAVPRPLAVNKANTQLSIGGYSARLSSFSIDQGNDVKYRNLTNVEDVVILDRKMTGRVSIELPLVAEKDFLGANGIVTLGTPGAMTVTHGSTAGNIVTAALPSVQLVKPKPKVENGIIMLDCELHIVRNQFTLTYT